MSLKEKLKLLLYPYLFVERFRKKVKNTFLQKTDERKMFGWVCVLVKKKKRILKKKEKRNKTISAIVFRS